MMPAPVLMIRRGQKLPAMTLDLAPFAHHRRLTSHRSPARRPQPRISRSSYDPHPSPAGKNVLGTAEAVFRAKRASLIACGVVGMGLGIYAGLLVSSAASSLATEASGHVLEVAIGTGRNLPFYDFSQIIRPLAGPLSLANKGKTFDRSVTAKSIISFTGVDVSSEMLEITTEKLSKIVPDVEVAQPRIGEQDGGEAKSHAANQIRLFRSDIQEFIPSPAVSITGGAAQYDTVVQTFGLCSVRDPAQVIRNLARIVKPDTGRIVLLEHGRGSWGLVNGLLDKSAVSHFQKYGCWWNRDIVEIVETAAASTPGLEIVKIDRPYCTQLGTTLWIELRVNHS
ncbi:Methyltransferase OMS1 [Colletotrichum orbiculare MAFF 240422]|uniref:Methyltransferase OMS1 n=1 Tax=Colletotrichum orbiculare (strain 104-T / ATCC 96160 / CBS 514.97 / LARS 414 / MAFF 240422) TaxID=1213857 RepID=A0A484G3P7_COLOR|nr:Methyltransferase OMS1 [Colletotrichum orbiculare MAFF 240422]